MSLKKYIFMSMAGVIAGQWLNAQPLTLNEAIATARTESVAAKEAKFGFVSSYWAYRSYRASLLPSLSLYGDIGNYNRSLALLQDYETGDVKYSLTNNMQNSLGLALSQNIALTGGTLSVYSDLARIDQFGERGNVTWYSQPITARYSQPLFSYNKFKWNKLISPKEYEKSKRVFLESMERFSGDVVAAYYALALAEIKLRTAAESYANTGRMLDIARQRLTLGSVRRDECLQLELRMINDSIAIGTNSVAVREARMAFNSLMGLGEKAEPDPVLDDYLPDVVMDYEFVLNKSLENSSFDIDNEITILNAQSTVAQAKADRGITMLLNARFGLSKTDRELRNAYIGPLDQEVVGLSFSVPIFDWGTGRGRVQKARAAEEVVRAQVAQSENDFRRQLFSAVGQFNNQRNQCYASRKARDISSERYALMLESFSRGDASVTDLNNAQNEYDAASTQYVTDLGNFWQYYYTLRQLTLYDFIAEHDIDVNPEELIDK